MGWPALTDLSRERTGRRHIVPFGRLTEWTTVGAANATATEVASESPTVVGPYALRLTADAVSGQAAYGTKDMAFSLNSAAGFWLLLNHRLRHLQGLNLTLYTSDAAALAAGTGRFTATSFTNTQHTSRTPIWVPKTKFTTLDGAPSWATTQQSFRVRIDSNTNAARMVDIEGIFTSTSRPAVMISFDDGWSTSYSVGHIEARRRGIPLNHFLIRSTIGAGGYITLAQAQEMRAQGDYLGLHGFDRWDEDTSRIAADVAGLRALGIDTEHAAYPEGQVGDGTAWQTTRAAMVAAGVKTARVTAAGSSPFSTPCLRGVNDPLFLPAYPLNSWITQAQAKAAVDEAIASGGTCIFYAHKLAGTADALTWLTSDYTALLDYIQQKRLDGLIDTPRWDDWYAGR